MKTMRSGCVASHYFRYLSLFATAIAMSLSITDAFAAPVHLRTNQRVNPLGIDSLHPTFSWQSDAMVRNWMQSAYRVLVASSMENLRKGNADVWDSGEIQSSESVNIGYAGPALKSRQRCFWGVNTWDSQGKEEHSTEGAWWEMGLLQSSDWQASWIRHNHVEEEEAMKGTSWIWLPASDPQRVPQGIETELKYDLHLDKIPAAATLHILVGGNFTTRVNGVVTGHKDQWGAFDWEDILGQLHIGENEIVVSVTTPRSNQAEKTYRAALAAALRLVDENGRSRWVGSDGTWQARSVKPTESLWIAARRLGALKDLSFGMWTDRKSPAPAPDRIESSTALFRKQFTPTKKKVTSARLYVTALGSYEAFLNGAPVSKYRLTPGFTDYRKRVLYQTYDVTSLVAPGKNTLAAVLGAGWHGSPLLWSGSRLFAGPDKLCAQLELNFADGTKQSVVTDSTWQAGTSPILSSEIYGGEAYDARLYDPDWKMSGSTKSVEWSPAVAEGAQPGLLVTAQPDLPVHPAQTIKPISVKMIDAGKTRNAVFDMGQNMVGVVHLHVRGPRGTTVKLRFAERLNPDGTVYTENLRDADATDYYTLSGHGDEEWAPAFTFHGFRYVQVSGYSGQISLATLQGEVLNSLPGSPSIRFESSSLMLNKMSELGLWGQRGNFLSIPTDCPQRDERMGWMGDAGAFWRTGTYNFDIDSFSQKFMLDVADGQMSDGAFPNIAPNLLQGVEGDPGAPGWGDAGVLVPYATWLQYGDVAVVEQSWPAMERWMGFILRTNSDYIRRNDLGPNYADWLAPDPHTPSDLVATAYWALIAQQMQTMASALGRKSDSDKYAALVSHIKSAYQQKYVHADGSVAGDTQTSYVVTLAMGLAPEELKKSMTDRLVKDIKAHQTHLTTGFLGTPFLLSALEEQGRSDVAYDLLLTSTYPSWGYMVDKGATTWWERWNGDTGDPAMNSYNHYAFGSVMAWVYRRVAGIDADPAHPGFHHVVIRPHVEPGLSHVHTEYDSVYGTIKTGWSSNGKDHLDLHVTIPANTSATVFLPAMGASDVRQDGKPLSTKSKDGAIVREIGSGSYIFSIGQE
jgi:alpha-L-rhamnosidase